MGPAPERAMSTAMKMEQTGSAIIHPNICMRMADTITPTLPRVSARMCRNTPCTQHNTVEEVTSARQDSTLQLAGHYLFSEQEGTGSLDMVYFSYVC